ncbi:MAG: hypothetical protein HQL72_05540 [Magnetococcales bacterium]|nr:hypothetical protein [Magnetococcales bacterium]
MKSEVYYEGIGEMGFHLGMVRMNLMGLDISQKDANGRPLPVVQDQAVMSLRGFLASLAAMQSMADKLVEAKVLRRTEQEGKAGLAPLTAEGGDDVVLKN